MRSTPPPVLPTTGQRRPRPPRAGGHTARAVRPATLDPPTESDAAGLDSLDDGTLAHIKRLAQGTDDALAARASTILAGRAGSSGDDWYGRAPVGLWALPPERPRRQRRQAQAMLGSVRDGVTRVFGPSGSLQALLPQYEVRDEQFQMARAIAAKIDEGGHVIVEAGTGVGKTLAYLAPAAMAVHRYGWRVLVSTCTLPLQDQIFRREAAALADVSGLRDLTVSVLKGRTNYLCIHRWQQLLGTGDLTAPQRSLLVKTLLWLPRTTTGDRAELSLLPEEEEVWPLIAATSEGCTAATCPYHRVGSCFLVRARHRAEDSDVVIVNHALLLSDFANKPNALAAYDLLIADEAHHLEDEATSQLGWNAAEPLLLGRLDALGGAVPAAHREPDLTTRLVETRQALRGLFSGMGQVVAQTAVAGVQPISLRVTSGMRAGSAWQELEVVWDHARGVLDALLRHLEQIEQVRLQMPFDSSGAEDAALLDRESDYWTSFITHLDEAIFQPDRSWVYWLKSGPTGVPELGAAPLDVADCLRESLFGTPATVVATSATLTVEGSFDYARSSLGLEEADGIAVGSPFDYRSSALLYLPYDLPDPSHPAYQAALEDGLVDLLRELGGRTLVLFTSRAHLRATYLRVGPRLTPTGVRLYGQGVDEASRQNLLEAFRQAPRAALFGTNSFWEGIDVMGSALSCVVVVRLPFSVPTDPIFAARSERYDDPFREYAVPQAVLRFKQGFGRLIRSSTDRGAVVVMDQRLTTRSYGSVFLGSLPDCTVERGPLASTGSRVAGWLRRAEAQSPLAPV